MDRKSIVTAEDALEFLWQAERASRQSFDNPLAQTTLSHDEIIRLRHHFQNLLFVVEDLRRERLELRGAQAEVFKLAEAIIAKTKSR